MMFDSTSLPQPDDPEGVKKMGLDLLDKLNQIASNAATIGTPHLKTGQQTAWLDSGRSPGASTWYTETFTVPAGTKAITLTVNAVCVGADTLRWRPYNNGDTYAQSFHRILVGSGAGAFNQFTQAIVLVDSLGRCDFAISSGAGNTFSIGYPQFYWQ